MTELSPQAQAVLDAADAVLEQADAPTWLVARGMAAALQAAADKIRFQDQLGLTAYGGFAQAQNEFLAIAAELEGGND